MLRVEVARRVPVPLSDAAVQRLVTRTARESAAVVHGVISVAFVGSPRMRTLNRTYHGEDRVTDVLAFPAGPGEHQDRRTIGPHHKRIRSPRVLPFYSSPVQKVDLGELVVCPAYVRRSADRAGEPFRRELSRMIVHGTLHLFGYDHATPSDAERMFSLQERILHHGDRGAVRISRT